MSGLEFIAVLIGLLQGVLLIFLGSVIRTLSKLDARIAVIEKVTDTWHMAHDKQDDSRHQENVGRFRDVKGDLQLLRRGMHAIQNAFTVLGIRAKLWPPGLDPGDDNT